MKRWVALLCWSCGCAAYDQQVAYSNVRPDPRRAAHFETETKRADAELSMALTNDVLDVHATIPVLCRKVLVRPLVADTRTEKTLTPVGRATQYGLLGSAVLLGALGAGIMDKPCPADLAGPGLEPGRSCDRDERDLQRGIGAGLLALGVAAAGTLFVNVIRLQPEQARAQPIQDHRSEAELVRCRELPLAGEPLALELSDGRRIAVTTAADGHARIDLKSLAPSPAIADRPFAVLTRRELRAGLVDLGDTALYRASADVKYAAQACQRRCDRALSDCQAALRRRSTPAESAGWICHGAERDCRDGCAGKQATAERADFVLEELTEIMGGLAALRPPLDAQKRLSIADLLARARALGPYSRGLGVLLDAPRKKRAAELLARLHAALPRVAPLLKQWAAETGQQQLLEALEVFRIGM